MVITVTYGIVEQLVIADKEPVLHLIRRRPSHRIDDKPQVIDARRLIFKLTRDALGLTNIFLMQTVWNWQSVNRASGIRRYSVKSLHGDNWLGILNSDKKTLFGR